MFREEQESEEREVIKPEEKVSFCLPQNIRNTNIYMKKIKYFITIVIIVQF